MDKFGNIQEDKYFILANKYREDAIADGWDHKPTYHLETEEEACKLNRDGFTMTILTRINKPPYNKFKYTVSLNIWGPDGLVIYPPDEYNFEKIKASLRHCNYCHEDDVDTERVSFAGRCCKKCHTKVVKKVEYPGWTK